MKKKTILFAMMAMAMTMTWSSCSDEEISNGSEASKSITVTTSIGNMTRLTTDEKGSQHFTEGDEISVYSWAGAAPSAENMVINNAINKLTDKVWVATPQMLWKDRETLHNFIGIYPTTAVEDLTAGAYKLNVANQEASDLLVAVNTNGLSYEKNANDAVKLEFTHVMAKLVVNLTYKNQWGGIPDVEKVVVSDVLTDASVNYLTKAVTPAEIAKVDLELPATTANSKYTTILVPQSGIQKLTITIGDKDYVYDNGSPFSFDSGKITTINLEVGRDEIILNDVKISDWEPGNTFGGEALD